MFAGLVRRHQDAIYRLALRMVGPNEAEDLAQQAFLKAWQALDRFRGEAQFGTWIYRIAMNLCFDHLRRTERFRPLPLEAVELTLASEDDPAATAEVEAEQTARRAALAWALERLPTEDQLLLHLRVGEELSYERIAELSGLNPRTVGTRLFRARGRVHALAVERLREPEYDLR